ncbi:MAG: hypothetical protein DPW09_06750 [Anaerolineae bacterium]|nr:zinc dependent phospholipase C family protein [Anaerolineales bacterium]MCQ3973134.1 hypothetical protein [Anaerolineae bacterium]
MAPFNTHFLIAEKIWPDLPGPWQPYYGQFCFGCVAPDVDKLSPALTQRDTHFFDRFGDYELMATDRSAAFLRHQAEFLIHPFDRLSPEAQAFALGYLCHLCVDEVSKHLWRREAWLQFKDIGPGPTFAALDEFARKQTDNYPAIVTALESLQIIEVIPLIPLADLVAFWQGVNQFIQAADAEGEYLALVDMFDRPTPEQRQEKLTSFRAGIDLARQRLHYLQLDRLMSASLTRSYSRLADLIEGRVPEPDYPDLE